MSGFYKNDYYQNPITGNWITSDEMNSKYGGYQGFNWNSLDKNSYNKLVGNTTSGFNFNNIMSGLGTLSQLGQAGAGLMNAFTGYKNYKMAKEAFGFEKALAQRNLANQAKLINNAYEASANVAAGLNAIPTASAAYNQSLKDKAMAAADKQKVSGTL